MKIVNSKLQIGKGRTRLGASASPFTLHSKRGAFTLIEIMIAVSVMAILMTLILSVVGAFISQARDSATKATISKIQALLNSRAQAFDRQMKRKGYLTGSLEYQYVALTPPYSNLPLSTQKIIATKILEARYFPQRYGEIYDATLYGAPATNVPGLYQNATAGQVPVLDSSEILYFCLTSNVLGYTPIGSDAFSPADVKDTDNDGLPEFIDAWGNPLRFYRWPTRLFRSQGQNANGQLNNITPADVMNAQILFSTLPVFSGNLQNDLARDPDDPLRECATNFQVASNGKIFENFVDAKSGVIFHTPATYHVMLVVSAGPDGELGLYEPNDTNPQHMGHLGAVKQQADWLAPTHNPLEDDIISLNIRAGGK
ncbi:MAG TPA: type II secretion system protein [Planctomycetaceae bacterium]|nr:type II secretion system protein [Planctomycetaceae bacterium]